MVNVIFRERKEVFENTPSAEEMRKRFDIPARKRIYRVLKTGELELLAEKNSVIAVNDNDSIEALSDFTLGR